MNALGRFLARFLLRVVDFIVLNLETLKTRLVKLDDLRLHPQPSMLSGGRLITVLMLVSMLPMMSWRGPLRQSALA